MGGGVPIVSDIAKSIGLQPEVSASTQAVAPAKQVVEGVASTEAVAAEPIAQPQAGTSQASVATRETGTARRRAATRRRTLLADVSGKESILG